MKLYYDFHIHSCLSPCGSEDMTPNNIVNMAQLIGLDAIAVSDHNSCKNIPAVLKCAEGTSLLVVPGIEVESREEVHILCLFDSMESLASFAEVIEEHLLKIPNKTEVFGEQAIMDENDKVIGTYPNLLITATDLSIEDVIKLCRDKKGVPIPAHIDREANSIITNLGFIIPEYGFKTIEISKNTTKEKVLLQHEYLVGYNFIGNSDAHYLENMAKKERYIEVDEKSTKAVIDYLLGVEN